MNGSPSARPSRLRLDTTAIDTALLFGHPYARGEARARSRPPEPPVRRPSYGVGLDNSRKQNKPTTMRPRLIGSETEVPLGSSEWAAKNFTCPHRANVGHGGVAGLPQYLGSRHKLTSRHLSKWAVSDIRRVIRACNKSRGERTVTLVI
jgi:hypothetical protein